MLLTQNRRRCNFNESHWLKSLNIAQHSSAQGLIHMGYDLAFVRGFGDDSIAILILDHNTIAINAEGEVVLNPPIVIR